LGAGHDGCSLASQGLEERRGSSFTKNAPPTQTGGPYGANPG
jgi:hypothetical protein